MRSVAIVGFLAVGLVGNVSGQAQTGNVRVEVHTGTDEPAAAAEVVVTGVTQLTDEQGVVVLSVPAGNVQVTVVLAGFIPVTVPVDVVAGQEQLVSIELVQQFTLEEEVTVVASTRTERRIEDQAMRVEVLNREEVEREDAHDPR